MPLLPLPIPPEPPDAPFLFPSGVDLLLAPLPVTEPTIKPNSLKNPSNFVETFSKMLIVSLSCASDPSRMKAIARRTTFIGPALINPITPSPEDALTYRCDSLSEDPLRKTLAAAEGKIASTTVLIVLIALPNINGELIIGLGAIGMVLAGKGKLGKVLEASNGMELEVTEAPLLSAARLALSYIGKGFITSFLGVSLAISATLTAELADSLSSEVVSFRSSLALAFPKRPKLPPECLIPLGVLSNKTTVPALSFPLY